MNITSVIKNMTQKDRGILNRNKAADAAEEECVNILLLTHRNSENTGDQMIEACDVSLITAVMKSLNKNCKINSSGVGMISSRLKGKR